VKTHSLCLWREAHRKRGALRPTGALEVGTRNYLGERLKTLVIPQRAKTRGPGTKRKKMLQGGLSGTGQQKVKKSG